MSWDLSKVIIADEDEASGLAFMIRDLLVENIGSFKTRAKVMDRLNGTVALNTADRNRTVSLNFANGVVEIEDGLKTDVPLISSDWKLFAKVASGQVSPIKSFLNKDMCVHICPPYVKNASLVLGTGFVLSVPKSFYEKHEADELNVNANPSEINGQRLLPNIFALKNMRQFLALLILIAICILVVKVIKVTYGRHCIRSDYESHSQKAKRLF